MPEPANSPRTVTSDQPGADQAPGAAASAWPGVSVVMPVLHEERHLEAAVRRALAQTYPGTIEVILALGPSHDRTDSIAAALARTDPRVRCVSNPTGATGAGLNAAIAVARHEVVVRLDGHAMIPAHYVRTAVETLERTGADNVGGVMAAEGRTDFERAVARAMTSRIGVGQARFHIGGDEGPVDTVYLGVFRRSALQKVGGYDESFLRAQDWELNHRIRRAGGVVWFTPDLQVTYRPRSTLRALARQYRNYGRWRRIVALQHRDTVNLRYLAAPAAVLVVGAGTLAGLSGLRAGFLAPAGYAAGVLGAASVAGRGLPPRARLWLPLVVATMHGSWGVGFLFSRPARRPVARSLT